MPGGRPRKGEHRESTTGRFIRGYQFDPEEFRAFEERTTKLGTAPNLVFRKVVTDYVNGRYVHLETLPGSTIEELRRRAGELRTGSLQFTLENILNEWAEQRARHKKP